MRWMASTGSCSTSRRSRRGPSSGSDLPLTTKGPLCTCTAAPSCIWVSAGSVAREREDAQQLQVEPDDRDHDPEGSGPAVRSRGTVLHALLDRVEVEHKRVGAHDDDEDADHQPERDAEDVDRSTETPRVAHSAGGNQNEVHHREEKVSHHRDEEYLGRFGRGA